MDDAVLVGLLLVYGSLPVRQKEQVLGDKSSLIEQEVNKTKINDPTIKFFFMMLLFVSQRYNLIFIPPKIIFIFLGTVAE